MDVDQSSQNEAMDGGGESKLKKGVLEDSGVTNQSMDVSSPAVQNRLSKNNNNGVSSKNNHTSAQNPAKNSVQNPTNPTQNTTAGQTLNNQSQQQQQNSPLDSSGNPAQSNPPAAIILPDCCKPNLDILIVGINPGYHSAITKHHYAGPTNHFWKCLYDSKLVTELLSSEKDYRLPAEFGIGLTNLCTRVTTSSSELTGAELRAGARRLMRRLSEWKPKIIAFNGMTAWRAFARHALRLPAAFSDSTASVYGTQPTFLEGTVLYAMPSSSARCAHFPTAEDKLPHYLALKQLKDSIALAGGSPCGGGLPGANNDENLVQPRLSINGLGQSGGVSGVGGGSNVASNVASGLGNNSDKLVKGGITGPGTPNDIFKNMDNFGNTSTSNSAIAGTNGAQNIGLGNNMFSQNNMFKAFKEDNNNSNTDALLQQLQTQAALNGLLSNNNQGLDITTLISLAMNGLQNQQSQQIQNQNNNIAAQLALINHNLTPNGMNFQNLDANTLSMLLGNAGGNGGNNNGIANQLGNSSLGNMNGGIGNMGNTGNNNSSDTMNQLLNAQHAQQQQAQLVQQLMAVQNSNSSAIDPAVTQLLQAQLLENQNSTGQNQQTYQNNNNGSNFQQLFTAQNQQVHRKTSNNQQVDAGQNDHLNFDFNNVTNFNQNSQNYNNMESNSMQQQLQQFNQLSNNNIGQFGNNNSTNVNNIKSENLAQQQATPAMHAVAMAHAHQQLQAQMNGGQSSGQMCQNPSQGGQIRQNGSLGQMGQNGHSGQSGQFGQNLQGQNQLNPMNLNQNQSNLNLTGNFNAGNLSQKQLSNSQVNINNKSQINSSQTPQPQAALTQAQELARSNQKQNSADKKQQMLKRRRHSDTAMEREKEKRVYNWIQEQEFLKYPP